MALGLLGPDKLAHPCMIERLAQADQARPRRWNPITGGDAMPDTADSSPHLLVVADVWCRVESLCDEVFRRAGDAGRVLVVAPALATRLHYWTDDTDRESEIARTRLHEVLARLERRGVRAEGRVATQDPALAVEDALDDFAATEVIVVAEDHEHANWSERGLTERIARPGLAVTRVTVAHEQAL
jgi:hypothetical protein